MAIRMLCPNGHELVTEDQWAGRKVRCPHCQLVLIVPTAPSPPQAAITVQSPAPQRRPPEERDEITLGDVIDEEEEIPSLEAIEAGRPKPSRSRPREPAYEDDDE